MAAPAASASATQSLHLSATDEWNSKLKHYHSKLDVLERISLNRLPYSVLVSLYECINNASSEWIPLLKDPSPKADLKAFIIRISESVFLTMQHIRLVAKKINALPQVDACFTMVPDHANRRQEAHKNKSMGLMKDLSEPTLLEIANQMEQWGEYWKLLADGLGFEITTLSQSATSPIAVLKSWMQKNTNATVFRLHFEAKLLSMTVLCDYLEAIPVQGTCLVPILPKYDPSTYPKQITRYHLERINKPGTNWLSIANYYFPSIMNERARTQEVTTMDHCRDFLWQYRHVDYESFSRPQIDQNKLMTLRGEVADGIFDPTSPGGVTYSQMVYLSKAFVMFDEKKGQPAEVDVMAAVWKKFGQGSCSPQSWKSPQTVEKLMQTHFSPNCYSRSVSTFIEFFFLYWQYPAGANLDLTDFCLKILSILREQKGEEVAEIFEKLYLDIKPIRNYEEEIARLNRARKEELSQQQMQIQMQRMAASASAAALPHLVKPTEPEAAKEMIAEEGCALGAPGGAKVRMNKDGCRTCFDRNIEVLIVPCGHLGYCLQCIQGLANCPCCDKPIERTVKPLKVPA